jgi:hypothetical protein
MATINTKITSLEVTGASVKAAFTSSNKSNPKFEAKLDGWDKWKVVTSPATFGPLDPGERTLSVRSYNRRGVADSTPATRTFTIVSIPDPDPDPDPDPTPDPVTELPLLKTFSKVEDWSAKLIEGTSSGKITNEPDGTIRFYAGSGPVERVELQMTGAVGAIPSERIYDWSLYVPSSVALSNNDWYHTLAQFHGNNQAGYTGGVGVTPQGKDPKGEGVERLMLRILGGKVTDPSGNRSYEYEKDIPLVPFKRNTWHHVRYHVRWSKVKDGFAKLWIDGQQLVDISAIPTASDWASGQMIRCGWYPQSDTTNYDMKIKDYKVYGK